MRNNSELTVKATAEMLRGVDDGVSRMLKALWRFVVKPVVRELGLKVSVGLNMLLVPRDSDYRQFVEAGGSTAYLVVPDRTSCTTSDPRSWSLRRRDRDGEHI